MLAAHARGPEPWARLGKLSIVEPTPWCPEPTNHAPTQDLVRRFPRGVRHLPANNHHPLNAELGRDYAWLPVTHTKTAQDPTQIGIWFHYMRGCSDTTWPVGRTILTRNKCDTAVQLEMRASGVSRDTALLRLAHKLIFDRHALYRNPKQQAALKLPENDDGSENVQETAGAIGRCANGVFGHDASGPLQCNGTLLTEIFLCFRSKDPAILLAELNVFDFISGGILHRELRNTSLALDTVQNHNRCDATATPSAILENGFCGGFVELWDVRDFSGSEQTGVLGHLNGTACEPSPNWPQCFSCRGSESEAACGFKCSLHRPHSPTRFVAMPPEAIVYQSSGDGTYLRVDGIGGADSLHPGYRHLFKNGPGGTFAFYQHAWGRLFETVPWMRTEGEQIRICGASNAPCRNLSVEISSALRGAPPPAQSGVASSADPPQGARRRQGVSSSSARAHRNGGGPRA